MEEALLRKANQKRHLDNVVIQQGEFDWRSLVTKDESALTRALGELEDVEDAHAAAIAAREAVAIEGADVDDFEWDGGIQSAPAIEARPSIDTDIDGENPDIGAVEEDGQEVILEEGEEGEEEGGTTVEYMLSFIRSDMEFFSEWRI